MRRTAALAISFVLALTFASWSTEAVHSEGQTKFLPGCATSSLPFNERHDIDQKCPRSGDPSSSQASQAQNKAKTNLCAGGDAVTITDQTFRDLQSAVEDLRDQHKLRFGGPQRLPPTLAQRPLLQRLTGVSLGEGSHVRMVAYLIHAAFSGGETVNCNDRDHKLLPGGQEYTDIHVYLSATPPHDWTSDADRMRQDCGSMTAEIIPHLRPDEFMKMGAFHDTKGKAHAFDRIAAAKLDRPLRITGQMFFDGSHDKCADDEDQTTVPRRFSTWEIHPVYEIDVCRSIAVGQCRADHDGDWRSFADYMDVIEHET